MSYTTFNLLEEKMVQLFQAKQYAEALEIITVEGSNFPDNRVWADYWKMCAAARVENRKLVYEVARQMLADGLWYGEYLWRQSPSFLPLQGDPEFEKIVADSHEAELRDAPEQILITTLPKNHSAESPLLIALHGNQVTAQKTLPFWESAVANDWVTAIPQSTQAMFKDAFMWDDLAQSKAHVASQYDALVKNIEFDPKRTVIAGHSMGGLVAIQIALEGIFPVCGFVVNGPAVPYLDEPEELEKLLTLARERGLRAYFIVGEQDDAIIVPEIKNLAEKIKAAGIPCEIEFVPNATHDYIPAYDAALHRGLEFVISGDA